MSTVHDIHHEIHEKRLEARAVKRGRKRKPKMAVSGKSVFTLRRIITSKSTKNPECGSLRPRSGSK